MTMQESVIKITSVVDRMIARCDAIADCAQNHGKKACNIFTPNESRRFFHFSVEMVLPRIVEIPKGEGSRLTARRAVKTCQRSDQYLGVLGLIRA